MDVFVIHSGIDADVVAEKLAYLKKESHGFNPLLLASGSSSKNKNKKCATKNKPQKEKSKKKSFEIPLWKIDARKKIKKAQMIIFFVGKESHQSENIDWEIKTAIKYGKPIYTIMLEKSYKLNDSLTVKDDFSGQEKQYNKKIDFSHLKSLIKKYENGDYHVFNQNINDIDKNLLLEQYKVFLQTSEDLVARRQGVNNFYISINSAIIAAFGAFLTLEIPSVYKFFVSLSLSTVGIILSWSWSKLLVSYGDLNSSKMKIISYIEKQLPASLYDAEWAALSDKLNKRKYVSFTKSEKKVPALFILVYIFVAIFGIVFLL